MSAIAFLVVIFGILVPVVNFFKEFSAIDDSIFIPLLEANSLNGLLVL